MLICKVLNLNGLVIEGDKQIPNKVKAYLAAKGAKLYQEDGYIIIDGPFSFSAVGMRKLLSSLARENLPNPATVLKPIPAPPKALNPVKQVTPINFNLDIGFINFCNTLVDLWGESVEFVVSSIWFVISKIVYAVFDSCMYLYDTIKNGILRIVDNLICLGNATINSIKAAGKMIYDLANAVQNKIIDVCAATVNGFKTAVRQVNTTVTAVHDRIVQAINQTIDGCQTFASNTYDLACDFQDWLFDIPNQVSDFVTGASVGFKAKVEKNIVAPCNTYLSQAAKKDAPKPVPFQYIENAARQFIPSFIIAKAKEVCKDNNNIFTTMKLKMLG